MYKLQQQTKAVEADKQQAVENSKQEADAIKLEECKQIDRAR